MFFIDRCRIPLDATHFAWLYKPADATKAAALSRTPSDNPLLDGEVTTPSIHLKLVLIDYYLIIIIID